MRRRILAPLSALGFVMGLAAAVAVFAPAHAEPGALAVRMDQSVAISLKAPAQSVVVGNPTIADVSVVDARTILVLGKSYGVTNLVVLDRNGRILFNREIVVAAPDVGRVSVWRGTTGSNYACTSRCEREPGGVTGAAAPAATTTATGTP